MSEMVERVARALLQSEHRRRDEASGRGVATTDETLDWRMFVPQARAAIGAMRNPTDVMADKGESSLVCGPLPEDLEYSPSISWAHAKSCWKAMIDAALAP